MAYRTSPGTRFPPGAHVDGGGVNFCVFSRHATRVELLLYAAADSPTPFQTVVLDHERHHSFFFWHVFVEALPVGTYYTWRIDGIYLSRQVREQLTTISFRAGYSRLSAGLHVHPCTRSRCTGGNAQR
jgi:pullulanase/glycogen debranching enzyme